MGFSGKFEYQKTTLLKKISIVLGDIHVRTTDDGYNEALLFDSNGLGSEGDGREYRCDQGRRPQSQPQVPPKASVFDKRLLPFLADGRREHHN